MVDRGGGSTERATGGFRAQFATEVNVRLSLLSRRKLETFREETGVDPGFLPAGYLFLAAEEAQRERLATALEVQRAAGSEDARLVTPEEIGAARTVDPHEGLLAGSFSPRDGFMRPMGIRRGYLEAALRAGVERLEAEVLGLERAAEGSGSGPPPGRMWPASWSTRPGHGPGSSGRWRGSTCRSHRSAVRWR